MPKKAYDFALTDFSGGINDAQSMSQLADNQLVEAENITVWEGAIKKRSGYGNVTPSHFFKQMAYFYKNDNTREFLGTVSNTLYRQKTDLTWESIPLDGTTSIDPIKAKFFMSKDRFGGDELLIYDEGTLKRYNGTNIKNVPAHVPGTQETEEVGTNDLNNLTNVRAVAIKDGRIIIAAHPTKKNMIHFSHVDITTGIATYDYFPARNAINIGNEDNDEIMDLKTFRNQLLVFGKRNVYSVRGTMDAWLTEDDEIIKLNVAQGVLAKNSICVVENSILYLTKDGVYEIYNTDQDFVSSKKISTNISNGLKGIPNQDQARGIYHNGCYYLSFPNGIVYVYHYELGAWVKWTNIPADGWFVHNNTLCFTHKTLGTLCQFQENRFNDEYSTYRMIVRTKNHDFQYLTKQKRLKELKFVFQQYQEPTTTFSFAVLCDSIIQKSGIITTDISGVYGEGIYGTMRYGWQDLSTVKTKPNVKGDNIQMYLESNHDGPLLLFAMYFEGKVKL